MTANPAFSSATDTATLIAEGRAVLGIELGSTRIKACLIDESARTIATGSHEWENEFVGGRWTYSVEAIWSGLQASYAGLVADSQSRYGIAPESFRAAGVSAMMHGYIARDADGELLVPFRTWRNTSTGPAAEALSAALHFTMPLRWSVAHLYQAVLDGEAHVPEIASLTTLAGYVHQALTGRNVLGVGDASGMFPIDASGDAYDHDMLALTEERLEALAPGLRLSDLLPEVLVAGEEAGSLTAAGAALLDPSGVLRAGVPFCPPEGDAGTGMVATNSVARRTGNVSVGTSIFAMVVLDKPLTRLHHELDIVSTPVGDAVAMVHCNNGASELAAWARIFGRFSEAVGNTLDSDDVFAALMEEASGSEPDAGGLLAFNYLAGEPVTQVESGRPLLIRTPESRFTLGNLIRAEIFAAFATLSIGMEALATEDVRVERLLAHGGLFRTAGAAQQLLAAALGVPVAVEETAGEGGAWGIAVLASYLASSTTHSLADFLTDHVFSATSAVVETATPADIAGFAAYLERYRAALPLQRMASQTTPTEERVDA